MIVDSLQSKVVSRQRERKISATSVNHRTARGRLRDFLLYCVIGILVAALAVFYGVHQAKTNQTPGFSVKWLGFAILTAIIFGNAIRYTKPFWGLRRFWGLLAAFAVFPAP